MRYTYDEEGQLMEYVILNSDGSINSKYLYEYEDRIPGSSKVVPQPHQLLLRNCGIFPIEVSSIVSNPILPESGIKDDTVKSTMIQGIESPIRIDARIFNSLKRPQSD